MRLTKHHGLGNDFLVLLDDDGSRTVTPDRVRALCDRHRGVGADGLIRATRPGEGVDVGIVAVMQLVNADGSPAEMSGNGIRCVAQALVRGGWAPGPKLPIATDAGLRTVTVHEDAGATQVSSVEMGAARVVGEAPEWAGGPFRRALLVDMGNPHLVLELAPEHAEAVAGDTEDVRLVELGARVNAKLPEGANVHLLAPDAEAGGEVAIRTYERGVGPTQACGTGACASAVAAAEWGLAAGTAAGTGTGAWVPVRQPGGGAEVGLGPVVVLRGPATYIATVDVPDPADPADPARETPR
jgi:diaminopimelate epimerase